MSMRKSVSYLYKAKVVSVYDGDTCRADIDLGFGTVLKNKTIRLSGIDTAEIRSDDKESALKARDRLRELILGKEIVLQTVKDRTGKYGRIIGTIYQDGMNVNEVLVEEGLAVKAYGNRKSQKKKDPRAKEKKKEKKEEKATESDSSVAVKIDIPATLIESVTGSSTE